MARVGTADEVSSRIGGRRPADALWGRRCVGGGLVYGQRSRRDPGELDRRYRRLGLRHLERQSFSPEPAATFAAVDNLRMSGWRGRVEGLVGRYIYRTGARPARKSAASKRAAALMAGYEWVSRDTTVSLWVGLDVKHTHLVDARSRQHGRRHRRRRQVRRSVLHAADRRHDGVRLRLILDAAQRLLHARSKSAGRFAEHLYVGPEVSCSATDFYRQYRVGAHLTGRQARTAELSAFRAVISTTIAKVPAATELLMRESASSGLPRFSLNRSSPNLLL